MDIWKKILKYVGIVGGSAIIGAIVAFFLVGGLAAVSVGAAVGTVISAGSIGGIEYFIWRPERIKNADRLLQQTRTLDELRSSLQALAQLQQRTQEQLTVSLGNMEIMKQQIIHFKDTIKEQQDEKNKKTKKKISKISTNDALLKEQEKEGGVDFDFDSVSLSTHSSSSLFTVNGRANRKSPFSQTSVKMNQR